MKKYKTGFVAGFFDILHEGHIKILELAKSQCEQLIVAVGTDEFMRERKGRESVLSYSERIRIVSAIRYVDKVVEETDLDKVAAYYKYKFDVMFVGDDWKGKPLFVDVERYLNEHGVEVVYFPYTQGTSSTILREKILRER